MFDKTKLCSVHATNNLETHHATDNAVHLFDTNIMII